MRKILTIAALAIACTVLAALPVAAQPGCCCDPIILSGSLVSSQVDCPSTFNFTRPPENLTETCTDVCKTLAAPPINVTPPAAGCDSPGYKAAPAITSIMPVIGEKYLAITFAVLCPAYSANISRCTGHGCTDFRLVAQASPSVPYTDADPRLRWNTTYTYSIVANYVASGASQPAIAEGSTGDLECWHRGTEAFCLSPSSYEAFEQYLKANGYGPAAASQFATGFEAVVLATFAGRFGKVWQCDAANLLFQNPATAISCAQGQQCVIDEHGPKCITPGPCDKGLPFGLFSSQQSCEGTQAESKYCFFDRSKTSVDACFACSQRMRCTDYRSRSACEKDNCNAGDCQWRDTITEAGIGVCIDTRFSNCQACTQPGTPGLENLDAFNEVFDRCTQQKADALSVTGHPCIFNRNAGWAVGCDAAACMDYSDTACSAPAGGIKLDANNARTSQSTDTCGISVCQIMGSLGCAKNSNGDDEPDCPAGMPGRRACEQDYFAPETTLVPSATVPGRMDWLDVRMLDRLNAAHYGELMAGRPGYRLRLCVKGEGNDCPDPTKFAETNLAVLNFNDLALQAGKTVLANLAQGQNTLRYYGIDSSNNPEIIKEMQITACNLCQGPKIIQIAVVPSRTLDNAFHTTTSLPAITVSFNEQATLQSPALIKDGKSTAVAVSTPGGTQDEYLLIPVRELEDGTYTLTFNAKDRNGIAMDTPASIRIIVDTTPGNVRISPADGSVLDTTTAEISFLFDEPLTLQKAVLEREEWLGYFIKRHATDLLPLLTTADSLLYSTTVEGLSGGKHNLIVEAEDAAGNPTKGKASFWIDAGSLKQRMSEPGWGTSPTTPFDITIETSRPAECRYVFDTPVAPPPTQFEFLAKFQQSNGIRHTIPDFGKISTGDYSRHKMHVYCRRSETEISVATYEISIDPSAPVIKSAFAHPSVIIERAIPDEDVFATTLKVQTDDNSFCRYSAQNVPFVLMADAFSEFEEIPKQSHDVVINVSRANQSHTYYVACRNTAGLLSQTVPIKFSVDLGIAFSAKSLTPAYSNSTTIALSVETNKRAFCFVGEVPEAVLTPMGAGEFTLGHSHATSVNASGKYTWHVQCSTGSGTEAIALTIPVTVDTTPPVMLYVNDSSSLENEPEFSYFLDQLRISFLGRDNETSIAKYYYRILKFFSNESALNWTQSNNLNGTAFMATGLNLTDGNKYRVEAYPVNIVGLQGSPMLSDGVTIDVEKAPAQCENSFRDGDETDIDCGGSCTGCLDGSACSGDTDCLSGFCNSGTCAVAGCDDGAQNGNETDIDCGGSCLGCGTNKTCILSTDCASGNCAFGVCSEPDACLDGALTGSETDIDCGGSCATKCAAGKNCQLTADCASGLICIDSTCQQERDSDNDGIKDDTDACPDTPQMEVADETGCSLSQKFSCNDSISDGWRTRYFGSVLCDGEGATGADPDNDKVLNAEEFLHRTDPTEPDSDFDGWNDRTEINKNTNPLDPADHPPSKMRILLWIMLVLMLAAGASVGGYLAYQYYLERRLARRKAPKPALGLGPKPRVWPESIERLRRIARRAGREEEAPGWLPLQELASRLKKQRAPIKKDAFDRLQKVIKGTLPKSERLRAMQELQKEPAAFDLLREIASARLSPEAKSKVHRQLDRLQQGKISATEREELFSRLRMTTKHSRTQREDMKNRIKGLPGSRKKRKQ